MYIYYAQLFYIIVKELLTNCLQDNHGGRIYDRENYISISLMHEWQEQVLRIARNKNKDDIDGH